MKSLLTFCIGLIIITGFSENSSAQRYSLKISSATFSLDGKSFNGYATRFAQPYKEVKKEWWRYVNSRMIIFNKKTHLELTIPAQKKSSNSPLKFVSQLKENENKQSSVLQMALATDEMPKEQISEMQVQAQHLLKDFKVNYFTELIQKKIESEEIASKKVSIEMDKYLLNNSRLQQSIEKKPEEKDKFAKKLRANIEKIEKLQVDLNAKQGQLARLKKELTKIK